MAEHEKDENSPSPEASEAPDVDGGEDVELDAALEELEDVEARRKRIGLAMGLGTVVLVVAAVLLLLNFRDAFVASDANVGFNDDKAEDIEITDDPECRKMIADIQSIEKRYKLLEKRVEKLLPGGDRAETRKLLKDLDQLQRRLKEAQELSYKTNLRFDRSEEELREWFDYVFNELAIIQDVAAEQLMEMGAGPQGDDSEGADAPDAGTAAEIGADGDTGTAADAGDGGVAADTGDAGATGDGGGTADTDDKPLVRDRGRWVGDDRPPEERIQGAVVRLHESFEKFEVWHNAPDHPCGDNDADEEPWRPKDWEGSEDESSSESAPSDDGNDE